MGSPATQTFGDEIQPRVFKIDNVTQLSASNDNYSNDTNFIPFSQRPETYVVPILFAMIFLVGVVGNFVIILIYVRNKSMRSAPNTLITSLAVGDFILLLGTVPFTCTIYTFESWPYGEFICKASEFVKDVSVGVTVFTLIILSLDRYLAIAWPLHRHKRKYSKRVIFVIVAAVWVLSLGISFPGSYFSFIALSVEGDRVIHVCYPFPFEFFPWYPRLIVLLKFVLFYTLPLFIISFFYILMACHLISTKNSIGNNGSQKSLMKARVKVAKIVLCLVLIFAFCLFPSHLFMMWFYFYPGSHNLYNDFWHLVKIAGYVLAYANSCLNPLVLYFISGVYKEYYKRYLCCCYNLKARNNMRRIMHRYTSTYSSRGTAITKV